MSEPSENNIEATLPLGDGTHLKAREQQKASWMTGKNATVEELMAAFPELKKDNEALLNLVFMEILHRDNRHESPTLAEYRKRFPSLGNRLAVFFPI